MTGAKRASSSAIWRKRHEFRAPEVLLKKSPVCVNNGPLVKDGERIMVNQHTGRFLEELAALSGGLRVLQYYQRDEDRVALGGLLDHDVNHSALLKPVGVLYRSRHRLLKQLDRLRMYLRMPFTLAGSPWAYCFLPGTLPLYACSICRHMGIPYGIYVRGQVQLDSRSVRLALAGARVVVCNNSGNARELTSHCRRVVVAAPMVAMTVEDLVTTRDVHREPPRVLFVGRVEAPKGIPELYSALEILAKEGLPFTCEFVGNGPLARVELLPPILSGRTHFSGFISDKAHLAECYKRADVLVLPSHSEGFPRVLYEAMTYGLPILTTFVGGVSSLMVDGGNCLEIKPRDSVGLARTLRCLLEDPDLRQKLSQGALATMHAFHKQSHTSHAEVVYKEMLA
jgi:glycosyltransferase involved in cell wall biosynthesis